MGQGTRVFHRWGIPFLFLSVLGTALAFSARAGTVDLDVELSPTGSFTSSSKTVVGTATLANGEYLAKNVTLALDTLNSGIDLRDRHMKEKYFETKKFPKAVLKEAHGKGDSFKGTLSLHGVEKEIEGEFKVEGSTLKATFTTTLSAFKIPEANYAGVGVEDEVKVHVTLPIASAAPAAAKK